MFYLATVNNDEKLFSSQILPTFLISTLKVPQSTITVSTGMNGVTKAVIDPLAKSTSRERWCHPQVQEAGQRGGKGSTPTY